MRAPAACAQMPPAFDDDHTNRIVIWQGDISTLEVDVITNMTDETLTESSPAADRIMAGAGPELKEEILTNGYEISPCSVVVTPGYRLRCSHILHAAAPTYNVHQHQASVTALHNCYTTVLYKALELGARSVAVGLVARRRQYPPDLAAHLAARTARRFIEQHRSPHQLILVAEDREQHSALLTAVRADSPLARDSDDRRIRIIHNPHTHTDTAEDDTSLCDEDAAMLAAARLSADTQRLLTDSRQPRILNSQNQQYEQLLRRARTEDLSEVSGIGCLYQSGVDRLGRPVVVFIGKWFPISDIDLDKALLYLIKLLDPVVRGDYVIAYFHTLASSGNHPPFSWLKEVYTVLPYKYKKNLKAFYIVHPTFWTKMMTWWFTTFMAPAIKAKVHTLPGVEYLYSVMARDQLEVPAFVTEYDMTINGLHYFQPDSSNT